MFKPQVLRLLSVCRPATGKPTPSILRKALAYDEIGMSVYICLLIEKGDCTEMCIVSYCLINVSVLFFNL